MRLGQLGFVFQAFNLVPVLTAVENVEFVLELRGVGSERRQKALAGLGELGLGDLASGRWRELDPGELRRLRAELARAAPARSVRTSTRSPRPRRRR